jgi:hypothetical protein
MKLAAAGNVEVPAILLLEQRGYAVTVSRSDGVESWMAARDDTELVGGSPLKLLALATLAEARGLAWRATDEQIEATLTRFGMS